MAQLQGLQLIVPEICKFALPLISNPTFLNLEILQARAEPADVDDCPDDCWEDAWWLEERGGADIPGSVRFVPHLKTIDQSLQYSQLRNHKIHRQETITRLMMTRRMFKLSADDTMTHYAQHGANLAELSETLDTFRQTMGKFADRGLNVHYDFDGEGREASM